MTSRKFGCNTHPPLVSVFTEGFLELNFGCMCNASLWCTYVLKIKDNFNHPLKNGYQSIPSGHISMFFLKIVLLQARLIIHSPVVLRKQMPCIFTALLLHECTSIWRILRNTSHTIQSRIQTQDLSISRRLLCHLSYSASVYSGLYCIN